MKSQYPRTQKQSGGWLALLALFSLLVPQPAFSGEEIDCTFPGRNFPATTIPECVDSDGLAVACSAPGRIKMWPNNGFRPASGIPRNRDSTDRVAGKTVPGRESGHELFSSVDIVSVGGLGRRLYVSYNAGLQVWDIASTPANPTLRTTKDGWENEFLEFPPVTEILNFIEDIAAVNVNSTTDVILVAGNQPVGPTIWEYNTTTNQLRQLYQDTGTDARQARLVKVNNGTIYGVIGSDFGVAVYNVTAARALASPCLEDQGSRCPTVFRGFINNESSRFIDTLHVPGNDRIYVSSSGGFSTKFNIWEMANPQVPSTAIRRFHDLNSTLGNALFKYGSHHYAALVSEADGLDREKLRILVVDECLTGNCSLANGTVEEAVNPIDLKAYPSANDFLSYSEYDGTPYLYYGVATGNIRGSDTDQLFDLRTLRPPSPFPLPGLPEVTSSGGSYRDPCRGDTISYWSHYYSLNTHGLNNMVPRVGKFSPSGYFYRAAATIVDVHVLGSGAPPPQAEIETVITTPQSEYWMGDPIGFQANASGDCTPSVGLWDWSASSNQGNVNPSLVSEITNQATYRYNCSLLGRCPNALVTAQAENSSNSCASADITPASLTVKDPQVEIVSADSGEINTFEQCQTVPYRATLAGRGAVWWEWRLNGNPIIGCSGNHPTATDLAEVAVGCDALASTLLLEQIFADGFESGNTSAWSEPTPYEGARFFADDLKASTLASVQLVVSDNPSFSGNALDTANVNVTVNETTTPVFTGSPTENVNESAATLTYPATGATTWSWEFRDPAGKDNCDFPGAPGVSCEKINTNVNTITHAWSAGGTYQYRVTISNCGAETDERTGSVTVTSGIQPDVISFGFNGGQAGCCLNGVGFRCERGTTIEFAVLLRERSDTYTFKFDWDRTSAGEIPSYVTQTPNGNSDPVNKKWAFQRTYPTNGDFYPKVRVEGGGAFDEKDFLALPLEIATNACGPN